MELFTFLELLIIAAYIKNKEYESYIAMAAFSCVKIVEYCSNALVLYIKTNHPV